MATNLMIILFKRINDYLKGWCSIKSMFTRYLLTMLLICLSSIAAYAQDEPWQTYLFTDENIIRITEEGLGEPIVLPDAAQGILSSTNTPIPVALSPDQHYFAFVTQEGESFDDFYSTLHIMDLESGDCCTEVPTPDGELWEVTNLGRFSPDSRYLAINFLNGYIMDSDARIAIYDIEANEYVHIVDPYDLFNTNAVFFIDWTDAGIEVIPTCFPCGASADGPTTLWNIETNEITPEYGYNVSLTGSRLSNGEMIEAVQDSNYPIGQADVMIGPFNVIQYFTADDLEDREIIYFDPDNLNLIDIEWVIDGQAYLIQDQFATGATLVWRTTETQAIEFESQQFFLTGTPDGWLMTDVNMQTLYQYQWIDGELQMSELGTYPSIRVLQTPALGGDDLEAVSPQVKA